ncbi:type II toxin-antitoxin system VapC family toxin [Sphingomonas sp. dw_22]|uniref:type II toxin-antitoxin system VapC family toxin n=1 Tax=Sphingomonas sp. dw_22 TaxID=2721175 RepID=UPI001BD39733
MILFVDASAVVAMMSKEPDALELADRIGQASRLLWSPIVKWEAAVALSRLQKYATVHSARSDVFAFGQEYEIELMTIGEDESEIAFEAFRLYGKRSGHAARLNMGDCFAYACARANNARLLYKGDDFSKTDLA